jgi:diguanylate cyclase (GGDEF)-like protein
VLAVPAILLALAVILMVAIGLRSAAQKSDQISVERQTREVWLALGAAQDDLAQSQTGIAIWNLSLLELRRPRPDWGWFDSNVGEYLNYVFAHHADFILDARDRPAYGMMFGVRVQPARYARFARQLAPLVAAVRGRIHVAPNPHERLPGTRPNPHSTARTSPRSRHATDLVLLNGRPAVVSVMRMIPDTAAVRDTPGREPLLVSIRYLDKAFAQDLSRVKLIAAARIAATPHMGADERAIPLVSSRGQRLGFLIWKPELPGSALLASLAPTAAMAVTLLIAVLGLLALRLARMMRENTHALSLLETAHTDLETAHAHLETAHAELQDKEALAHHRALHDSLTGLPNRVLFNDSVEQALAEAADTPPCTIMLLDLDRFKQVNDTLGHHAGDILIQQVAARLNVTLRPGDIAARLGGDEFAILVRSCPTEAELEHLASSLVRSLRRPFYIQRSKAFVGVSIGIATADGATSGRSETMRRADLAMYQAKEGGRGGHRFFTIDMEERALLRNMLERDFREALSAEDQLFIEYQPRVAASK